MTDNIRLNFHGETLFLRPIKFMSGFFQDFVRGGGGQMKAGKIIGGQGL